MTEQTKYRIIGIRRAALERGDMNLVRECDLMLPSHIYSDSGMEVALPGTDTLEAAVPVKRGPGRPRNQTSKARV